MAYIAFPRCVKFGGSFFVIIGNYGLPLWQFKCFLSKFLKSIVKYFCYAQAYVHTRVCMYVERYCEDEKRIKIDHSEKKLPKKLQFPNFFFVFLDAAEEVSKEELREKAKKELEEWYKQHEEQVAKTRQANR